MTFLDFIVLQADSTATGAGEAEGFGKYMNWILIGGVVVVFYFFMLRPQQKRQKEEKAFREGLGKGDKVVSIGGIHGKIVSVEDSSALVEVDNGTKMRFEVAALKPAPDPNQGEDKK